MKVKELDFDLDIAGYLTGVLRPPLGSQKLPRLKLLLWRNIQQNELPVMILQMICELMTFIKMVCYSRHTISVQEHLRNYAQTGQVN